MNSQDDTLLQPLLDRFEAVLERESTALRSRDVDALEQAVAEKEPLLRQLADAPVGELSDELRAQLSRIRERNEINGLVIQRSSRVNDRLLSVLRGEPRNDLYGASGGRARSSRSRDITSV